MKSTRTKNLKPDKRKPRQVRKQQELQHRLEVRQIAARVCEGWHEPPHPTQGPVVVLIGPNDEELTLCLCCGVDFQNDITTPDDDRELAGLALGIARSFRAPLR